MRSLVLFVLLVSLAGLAADRFRVVSVRGPEAVSPGEAIAVHLTVEVVEVDAPVYLRPFAAYSFASSRLARNLPAESMVPWKLAKFQVGDTLKVTARLTVPSGVEPGEKGAVIFRIYRPDTKKEVRLEGGDRAFFTVVAPRKVELAPSGVGVPVAVVPRLAGQPVLDGGMEGYWGKAAELPVDSTVRPGGRRTARRC